MQFPSPVLSAISKFVAFVAGSFAAVLLFLALAEDTLVERRLFDRTLVWCVPATQAVCQASAAWHCFALLQGATCPASVWLGIGWTQADQHLRHMSVMVASGLVIMRACAFDKPEASPSSQLPVICSCCTCVSLHAGGGPHSA